MLRYVTLLLFDNPYFVTALSFVVLCCKILFCCCFINVALVVKCCWRSVVHCFGVFVCCRNLVSAFALVYDIITKNFQFEMSIRA